jgi:predicted dehydrogenase
MPNAYKYEGQSLIIGQRQGENDGETELIIQAPNQFSQEIDHMATCVLENKEPYTPGEEGVQDHKLMEAIYEAARTGQPVRLEPQTGLDAFRGAPPTESS